MFILRVFQKEQEFTGPNKHYTQEHTQSQHNIIGISRTSIPSQRLQIPQTNSLTAIVKTEFKL